MNNCSYDLVGMGEHIMQDSYGVERCEGTCVHEQIVEHAARKMPGDDALYDLAELYKLFGDTTRIKILYALSAGEICVCDIAQLLGMTQSAISHHLRSLKQSKLVKFRRDGKTVYYSLADAHVETILEQGMEHVLE
ncbi:Transcriptional repressor SmtB [bioreactor metagenome]|uniref:Transcriptional repressor SmtB n=1 Tax=bioreactor metagenome TaxID=1076179 RepID=A0A645J3K9_9ZZZZ